MIKPYPWYEYPERRREFNPDKTQDKELSKGVVHKLRLQEEVGR